jgi:lipid A 3-O-deacylase
MRYFTLILLLLFLAAGCDHSGLPHHEAPEEKTSPGEEKAQVVVDYPAAIILHSRSLSPDDKDEKEQAGELLRHLNIPLINPESKEYLFVKTDGDTVLVNLRRLEPRHTLILFTHHRDPQPINYSELPDLLKKEFPEHFYINHSNPYPENEQGFTLPGQSGQNSAMPKAKPVRVGRKVVVSVRDTARSITLPETKEPVTWVFHTVNKQRFLRVTFENDLVTLPNSDRYFTNGINIELQAPFLEQLALNNLMIPYRKNAHVTYTVGLYQDIFTPADTRVAPHLGKDRPYASYLLLSYRKSISNVQTKFSLTSEIRLGYLGPHSPGKFLQSLTHETIPTNDPPIGWELQLNSNVIVNYMIKTERALMSRSGLELSYSGVLNVGTLYTDAGAGLSLYAGRFPPFYQPDRNDYKNAFRYSFYLHGGASVVGFNALIQGGVFTENVAALPASHLQRLLLKGEFGLQFGYRSTSVVFAQHFLSPEYKGGLPHKWGRISFYFGI